MLPSVFSKNHVLVVVDNQIYHVNSDHFNYNLILDAIKNDNKDEFLRLFSEDKQVAIEKYIGKDIQLIGDKLIYKGVELSNGLTRRIIEMRKNDFPIDHMLKFLENLMNNPSMTSINELFDFLENSHIPITEDGCFLGYKAVRPYSGVGFTDVFGRAVVNGDLLDKHSATTRNNVGDVIKIERNKVDDNRERQCSYGYHIGGLEYATQDFFSSGDVVVLCKVNPAAVVAVPKDYNCQKLRTCEYEVVSLYNKPLNKALYLDDEEYDYDDTYENQKYSIDPSELRIGDSVYFDYKKEKRFGVVDSLTNDKVTLILDKKDPSYEGIFTYRCFNKSEIDLMYLY